MRNNLANLQRLLYRLITAPEGLEEALDAEPASPHEGIASTISGDKRLSAVERIRIYADGYFYRVLGVMREEYPATSAVLGEDRFSEAVRAYLAKYPPGKPSIFYAGEHFAAFLTEAPDTRLPFVADLARLERALIEVFHAADAPSLDEAKLRAIPPNRWPSITLRTHPAAQIVDARWRVGEVRRAVDQGKQWMEPAAHESRIVVWRQNNVAYFRELEHVEYHALDLLLKGMTFAVLCDAIAAECGSDAAVEVNRLLHRWVSDGLIVSGRRTTAAV